MIYAVGDVHGCFDSLLALEARIVADAADVPGDKWLVMLGDYIDRGPDSGQVLDHLIAPPPTGFARTCLAGNHEQMLLDFLADPRRGSAWLDYGGDTTLASYGVPPERTARRGPTAIAAMLRAVLPEAHAEFVAGLPVLLQVPGYVFVHAGIAPGVKLERQEEADLMWIREPFLGAPADGGPVVVHGHTPETEPVVTAARIGIDTAAYATGRLTAARIPASGPVSFIST